MSLCISIIGPRNWPPTSITPYRAFGSIICNNATDEVIHGNNKVVSYSDAVRNVCNATLSLLFTASLFIWGFFINRKRAWRTDGGTAAFGVGALTLAILSTVLNFLYIPTQDQYDWLPGFMWAVVLWQSFLGWWWWAGAGMGVGEIDELLRRRKKKTEEERKLKKEREERTNGKGEDGLEGHDGRV